MQDIEALASRIILIGKGKILMTYGGSYTYAAAPVFFFMYSIILRVQ